MQWMYIDSQFHEAIVAAIGTGVSPLRNPGFFPMELPYHYGRHVLAHAISFAFGLTAGDAMERGVCLLGLAALTLAAIAVGRATVRAASARPLAGLYALALVFFAQVSRAS